jgi:hypothetical protein
MERAAAIGPSVSVYPQRQITTNPIAMTTGLARGVLLADRHWIAFAAEMDPYWWTEIGHWLPGSSRPP